MRRTAEGLAISHAIRLLLDRLAEGPAPAAPGDGRPPAALAEELELALTSFDAAWASAVIAEASALHPIESVCQDVVGPMLIRVGDRWHDGELSVAAEHFATAFVRRKLFALLDAHETGRGRGLVFAACAPEDWHEVGILMVSLFLVRRGFRVAYLGPSLTAVGLGEALRRQRPDLLCISATWEESADRLREIVEVVESLPPPRPRLAYGGQAFADPARRAAVRGV
jgi:methanogenic corrinoid protein MtbC1